MSEITFADMTDEQLEAIQAEIVARRAAKAAEAEKAARDAMLTEVSTWLGTVGDVLDEARAAHASGDLTAVTNAVRQLADTARDANAAVRGMVKSSGTRTGAPAVRNGELRDMVRDWLTDHAGEHGPSEIATSLGRSSGAVGNACDRLVELGEADMTKASPKRYSRDGYAEDAEAADGDGE